MSIPTQDQLSNNDDDDELEVALSSIKGIFRHAKKRRLTHNGQSGTDLEIKTLKDEKVALERALEVLVGPNINPT